MRIVITGSNGFVGKRACRKFTELGHEVIGITNSPIDVGTETWAAKVIQCDLSDPDEVSKLHLDDCDALLNLAGIASNAGGNPDMIRRVNVGAHVNLYRRLGSMGLSPRIIAVSSGLVYKITPDSNGIVRPLTELDELQDVSLARPYEASKIMMEQAVAQEFVNMDIVVARPFNHVGPGQGRGFITSDLAYQIEQALREGKTTIATGNLTTERDYTHVDDIIDGYVQLITAVNPAFRVYNLCSGRTLTGNKILQILLSAYNAELEPVVDPSRLRPNEVQLIVGNHDRITQETGWRQTRSAESALREYVADRQLNAA